ncbi:ATP-dependent DNA helicase DinG [Stenotrophomonas bentonitica]|uniref:ATP-dependent DNA helicase DinG n=1 Tax=Stenotrophomonas bentonitica TaxID=1450134 RepID=UPI003BAB7647
MTEKVEAPRALNDELKAGIRDAYAKLQANTPGFSTRRSQSQMIGVVSRALSHSGGVGVVEAPTGVGKSLGYLTAGVPIALATKKKLVISTGTVALQSQLVERDIPNFLKATGIEATVALAKGRTRYLCTRNAAEAHGDGAQEGMFEDEQPLFDRPLAPIEMDLAQSLSKAFLEGRWNGDLDNAPETISNALRSRITTPASGCAGRKCAYAAQCAVLRSRNTVREAQIVVTNHALLLSALSIGESDNGQPLIAPPSDMLLVLDEGHHIGNVAIDQGAASLALDEMAKRTGRLQILIAAAYRAVDKDKLGNLLPNEAIEVAAKVSKQLKAFRDVIDRSWRPDPSAQEPMWRAPNGRLPEIWMPDIEAIADDTRALFNWAHAAHAQVAKGKPEDAARERLQRNLGMALEMIEQQHNLWTGWRREDKDGQPPTARWITLSRDGDLVLHGSPVSAANVLRKLLWDEVDSVVMTSATLTGGGDFQALAIDNGIPAEAEMVSLASPFDLPNQAQLIVPAFPVTPDDKEGHPKEIAKYLVKELDWGKGSIVLFTSRWKMEKVAELMPAAQRKQVLVQGETAKQKMIDEHLRRTSAGEGSVLFGLNSFGEGLDLPGEACTTVVITQVPFAVPTDPQTSTLSEWFESRGLNAFNLIAIPHALRTLTQFSGRLIRTSTDTGRVIILDSRLLTRRYGKRIIDSLPPFKRVIG